MQANHKFGENNAVLVTAFHPLLGKVGAVVVTQDMEAGEEVKSPSNLDFNLTGTKWDNHVFQVSLDYGYQPENSPGWYSKLWIQYQVDSAEKVLGRKSKLHSEVTVNLFRRSLCSKTGMLSFWILEWTTSFSLKTYFRKQNNIPVHVHEKHMPAIL